MGENLDKKRVIFASYYMKENYKKMVCFVYFHKAAITKLELQKKGILNIHL